MLFPGFLYEKGIEHNLGEIHPPQTILEDSLSQK